MTESEWLVCADPLAMLKCLRNLSERKLRLFGCQILLHDLPYLRHYPAQCFARFDGTDMLAAIEGVILLQETHPEEGDNEALRHAARDVMSEAKELAVIAQSYELACYYREQSCLFRRPPTLTNFPRLDWGDDAVAFTFSRGWWPFSARDPAQPTRATIRAGRRTRNVALIRDIFGNPFCPVIFDAEWRTSKAVALAQGMYDARDFSAMPILADALQDAGCENDEVLNHCRAPGPHVRGCWVVDLVLGKE